MTSEKNCRATHPAKGRKGRRFLRCILNSISFGSQQRRCCQWSGDNSGGSEKVRWWTQETWKMNTLCTKKTTSSASFLVLRSSPKSVHRWMKYSMLHTSLVLVETNKPLNPISMFSLGVVSWTCFHGELQEPRKNLGMSFVWELAKYDFTSIPKGQKQESDKFQIFPGINAWLQIYPKGNAKSPPGRAAAFLCVDKPAKVGTNLLQFTAHRVHNCLIDLTPNLKIHPKAGEFGNDSNDFHALLHTILHEKIEHHWNKSQRKITGMACRESSILTLSQGVEEFKTAFAVSLVWSPVDSLDFPSI